MKKILVAYDGSTQSKKALDWAIDLSLLAKGQVMVVKVTEMMDLNEMSSLYEDGSYEPLIEQIEAIRRADRRVLEEAISAIGDRQGVAITTALLHGNIAASIIAYANENEVDLIVAGTKGHGVLEGLLMGSVTRNLVSLSKIPVFVVKD